MQSYCDLSIIKTISSEERRKQPESREFVLFSGGEQAKSLKGTSTVTRYKSTKHPKAAQTVRNNLRNCLTNQNLASIIVGI